MNHCSLFLEKNSGDRERDPNRSSCRFLYAAPFSSCIARNFRRYGSGRIMGSCADPRGEQRLRPLEVVRYSDVDKEPRANQPKDSAVEKAGKNLPLQRDGCPRWQVADDLFSKQINAGVNQTGAASDTFFEKLGEEGR